MVCQRNGLQAWRTWHNGVLGKVEGKMRGGGCAPTVAHNENAMPMAIGLFEQPQNLLKMRERGGPDHLLKLCKVAGNSIQCLVALSFLVEQSNLVCSVMSVRQALHKGLSRGYWNLPHSAAPLLLAVQNGSSCVSVLALRALWSRHLASARGSRAGGSRRRLP